MLNTARQLAIDGLRFSTSLYSLRNSKSALILLQTNSICPKNRPEIFHFLFRIFPLAFDLRAVDFRHSLILQCARLPAVIKNLLKRNPPSVIKLPEVFVKKLHPQSPTRLDARINSIRLVLPNKVSNSRRYHHEFVRSNPSFPGSQWAKRLAQYGNQVAGQLNANLLLLIHRKNVDNSADSARRTRRVHRTKHKVPRFCSTNRCLNCLKVAQFAYKYHVRVHPQHTAKSFPETRNINTYFTLVDDALLMTVIVLNRVFNRHDMAVKILVDVVHHTGQRCSFSAPGRTRNQEHASRPAAQRRANLWQPDLLKRHYFRRN